MKKRIGIVIVYVLVFALALFVYNPFSEEKMNEHSVSYYSLSNDDQLYDNVYLSPSIKLEQRINIPKRYNLKHIDIKIPDDMFASNVDTTPFPISVSFIDSNGDNIGPSETTVIQGHWMRIKLPEQIVTKAFNNDVSFSLVVTSTDGIVSLISSTSTEANTKYTIDNVPYNNTLVMRGVASNTSYLYIGLWIYLFIAGLICCFLLNGFTTRSYLLLSGLFGIVFTIIAIYPTMFESGPVINSFRRMVSPAFAETSASIWLPSRILNETSHNNIMASIFTNDYSIYSITPNIGYSVLEWVYVPVLLLARSFNMAGNMTILAIRLFSFVVCVLINSIAITKCKRIRPVLFTVSLLPVFLLSFSTVSIYGLLLSFTNLFLSLLYATLDDNSISSEKHLSLGSQIVLMIILLIVSIQNLVLGLLLFILINYIQNASNGIIKQRIIWCGAVMYCLALAVNVLYVVLSKDFFDSTVNVINTNVSSLFANPIPHIKQSLNSIAASVKAAISSSTGTSLIIGLLFSGLIAGVLASLFHNHIDKSQDYQESESALQKPGVSLIIVGAIISAIYLFVTSLSGVLTSNALTGLFAPFTCFILASVYSRTGNGDSIDNDRALPYILMAYLMVYISSCLYA